MKRMDHCYRTLVAELLEKNRLREEEIARGFHTAGPAWFEARAAAERERFRRMLLSDFERAPLLPRLMGTIRRPGYHIEKLLIQSMPGYDIPVHVYRPEAPGPHPPLLVSVGHCMEGKAVADNQILCANLAMMGFVVAIHDPPCQGERGWLNAEERRALFGDVPEDIDAVNMHMLPGNLCYLLGENLGAYFVWDGMRVIDYLLSRPDVTPSLLGATGRSGGGTLTTCLAALDDRVRWSSPVQCLSSLALTLTGSGIGDCEQSMLGVAAERGYDFADMLWAAWPKPVMVNAGLRDFFSIEGVRLLESELARLYRQTGRAGDFTVETADCAHENTPQTRGNTYRWFRSRVLGETGEYCERAVELLPEEALRCLPGESAGGTILEVVNRRFLSQKRQRPRTDEAFAAALRRLLPVREESVRVETLETGGRCASFLLHTTESRSIYCKLYDGEGQQLHAVIRGSGRALHAGFADGPAPLLVLYPWGIASAGKRVSGYDDETMLFNLAAVLGQNLFLQRLNQVCAALRYAAGLCGCEDILLAGDGVGGLLAIFAAWFCPGVRKCAAVRSLPSFDGLFGKAAYLLPETAIIPGFCRVGDIADVARAARADCAMIQPLGADGSPAGGAEADAWRAVLQFWEVEA